MALITLHSEFIKPYASCDWVIFTLQLNLGSVEPVPLPSSTCSPQYSLTPLKVNLSRLVNGIEHPYLVLVSKSKRIHAGSVVHSLSVLKVPFHVPEYVIDPSVLFTVALFGIFTLYL